MHRCPFCNTLASHNGTSTGVFGLSCSCTLYKRITLRDSGNSLSCWRSWRLRAYRVIALSRDCTKENQNPP